MVHRIVGRLLLARSLFAVCLITLSLFLAAPSNYSQARPLAPAGVRAVWVRPFINADEATRRSPENGRMFIRRELQRIKRAGFDTVYVESFFDGYTIYPSSVAKQRPLEIKYGVAFKDSDGRTRSWDVLQAYLNEGRALGLNIHAWFQVFFAWHTGLGPIERSPIFGPHPEWLALDKSGSPLVSAEAEGAGKEIKKVFMSPSHPGVQRFLVKLVNEVCLRYPQLGGIQLDYIRYPTHTPEAPFDYNLDALNRFRRATGLDARRLSQTGTPADWVRWEQWKTGQVTLVVRELSQNIRTIRPSLIISAAVFPDFAQDLRVKMQDTREWSRLGLIDALLPMLYSEEYARVDSWAREFREGIGRRTRVYPALYIGHFYNPQLGSFDSRYLELKTKYEFEGVGLFAAQLLTDDLVERLAATRLN